MNNLALSQSERPAAYAQNISELTPAQWIHYLMLLSRHERNEISTEEFKDEWLRYLQRLLPSISMHEKKMTNGVVDDHHMAGFFKKGTNGEVQIDTYSVKNNLPQYTWNYTTYTGPQDMCLNLSFGTFLSSYFVFKDYSTTQNPEALRYLFALLYKDGKSLEQRVEALSNIPEYVAFSACYFFRSVVTLILSESVNVRGEDLHLYQVFEAAMGRSGVAECGIEEALFDMASEGGFPVNPNSLKQQNLYDVLRFIWFRTKNN